MNASLVRAAWLRAADCCEYCRLPQAFDENPFEIDHAISRKHGGLSELSNLSLSCFWCNAFKGSDIAGRDVRTRRLVPLFNPRRHKWTRHFRWMGPILVGRTPIGRVTITLLKMNDPFRIALRDSLIVEGLFPPE